MKISFVIELVGYANAVLGVAMLMMRTMIPLRIAGILHNVVSIMFGTLAGVYPMHGAALQSCCRSTATACTKCESSSARSRKPAAGDHSMEWIKPFTTKRDVKAGQVLFRKGDVADRMYFVVSGKFVVARTRTSRSVNGAVVGELAFLAPTASGRRRCECVAKGEVLEIDYDKLEQLYYQNPSFGFYFLQLTSARLFDNIDAAAGATLHDARHRASRACATSLRSRRKRAEPAIPPAAPRARSLSGLATSSASTNVAAKKMKAMIAVTNSTRSKPPRLCR